MRRMLILGTDTDVGKTYVAATICRTLLSCGISVAACKPVETGVGHDGESDLDRIRAACADHQSLRCVRGVRYAAASAPSIAARLEQRPAPSVADFVACVRGAEAGSGAVIVESCGGALTPLSQTEYAADAAASLRDYRTLLVAQLRLGMLSQTFGAAEYLRAHGIEPAIVLNASEKACERAFVDAMRAEITGRGLMVLAYLPHGAAPDGEWLDASI